MRLVEVKLTNYRGYQNETSVQFDPLTVLVGRNDAGKSSVLDALDTFFNEAPPLEKDDCCVRSGSQTIRIGCVFDELPTEIVLDATHPTTLEKEYLTRSDGMLEIVKEFKCSSTPKKKADNVFAIAHHPSAEGVSDLLSLTNDKLKDRAKTGGVDVSTVNQTVNSELRGAIWSHAPELELTLKEVDLNKEGGKAVWDQLSLSLPIYALFKSDRTSTDQDSEAQDPMKAAIKEAIKGREKDLEGVIADITTELDRVASRTVDKIREMSPELANELKPHVNSKNWETLFSVKLTGDEDIPINKRGSGTRRLILLNFFRAKAEETSESKKASVIYAIEEPETSQHPNHQIMLLNAFEDLVASTHCQIVLTTHTPTLARRLPGDCLRLVEMTADGPVIHPGIDGGTLTRITNTLGVLPDHDIKAFFGIEGKHDIEFLRRISTILASTEADIPDLGKAELDGKLVFVPLGGSSLELWALRLKGLGNCQ